MWSKKRTSVTYTPRSLKRPTTLLKRRVCNAASTNIKVVVRVRPPNDKDTANRQVVQVVNEKCLVFDPKEYEEDFYVGGQKQLNRDMLKKRHKNIEFQFDRVFDQDSNNNEVFEGTTQNLISSLLDGFNCSVFVYGATGAGKTYTMLGSKETPGIAFLTMAELYEKINEKSEEYKFDLKISYLEVYNETVKDLICPSGPLHLLDDGRDGVIISGIKTHHIESAVELFQMLELGNRNRTQHPTDSNAESSRSHAVFQVHLSITNKLSVETKVSKLTMIDLAGSERGGATGGKGIRFSEGSNINKSLLALGNCVDALAEGHKHIPYRNSKLTRILKDSLGGNCKSVIIVNVAPSSIAYEETFNTLNYANRAKKISNKATRNLLNVDFSVAQYKKIIEDLKQRISSLENENKSLREGKTIPNESGKSAEECRDLAKGRQVLHCLYELEEKYNKELLMYQIKKKTVDWKLCQKQVISQRFQLFEYMLGNTKNQSRMDESITSLKVQRIVYKDKVKSIQKLLKEKRSLREIAMKEIEAKGLMRELKIEVDYYASKMKEESLEAQVKYYKDLLLKQQNEMTNSDNIINRICKSMDYYFSILKGYGNVTEQMNEQYLALVQQLAGVKSVSWGDQPSEFTLLRKIMDLSFISPEPMTPAVTSTPPAVTSTPPAVTSTPPAVTSTPPVVTCTPPALFSTLPCSTISSILMFDHVPSMKPSKIESPFMQDSAATSIYRVPSTPSLGLHKIAGYLSPEECETKNASSCKQEPSEVSTKSNLLQLPDKLDFNTTFTVDNSLSDDDDDEVKTEKSAKLPSENDDDSASVETRKCVKSSLVTDNNAAHVSTEKFAKSPLETVTEETTDFQNCIERPNRLDTTFDSPQPTIFCINVESAGSDCLKSTPDSMSLNTTFVRESSSPEISCTDEVSVPILNRVESEKGTSQCNEVNKLSVLKSKPQVREVRSNLPIIRNGTSSSTRSSGSGGSSSCLKQDNSLGRRPKSVSIINRLQMQPSDKPKVKPGPTIKIQYNALSEKNKIPCELPKAPVRLNACLESNRLVSSSRIYQKENKITSSIKRDSSHTSPKGYTSKIKNIRPVMRLEKPYEKKFRVGTS